AIELPGCPSFDQSPALWKELGVDDWIDNQVRQIRADGTQGSESDLANKLFQKFAPKCPSSQCHCNSFQSCS
ncbi:hypothetical protein LTS18_014997, partial [Coniosporium uncinatum]